MVPVSTHGMLLLACTGRVMAQVNSAGPAGERALCRCVHGLLLTPDDTHFTPILRPFDRACSSSSPGHVSPARTRGANRPGSPSLSRARCDRGT